MEWLLRTLSFLQILLLKFLQPFFWLRDRAEVPRIPRNDNPLLLLTACDAAKKIRDGEMTSESIVKSYIERIQEVNPIVNAVIEDRFAEALNDAKLCDKRLNSGEVTKAQLEIKMPLYGVPFTVKESCSLKGLSYTGCTLVRQGIKATADSSIVASMRNAGAIPLCVTNTPELCSGFDASNFLFGATKNPYNVKKIAGGSSGGEGALLGAGASLIGIGSDIAGSIRVPALFNGVFGHKPSPGIIPITGHFPTSNDETFNKYLVVGPMARYVEDLAMAMRVMSGAHAKKLRLDETIDVRKLNIFYLEDAGNSFGNEPVDTTIKRSINRAASYMKDFGSKVSEAPIGSLSEILEITVAMFFAMKNMPQILMNPADPKNECNGPIEMIKALLGMSQYTKSAILIKIVKDAGGFIPKSSRQQYVQKGEKLREKLIEMLGDDGVLFYPTFISPAPSRGKVTLQAAAGSYCMLVNVFGLPATHVPIGINGDGLPVGFQVIAAPNQDRLCLAVARVLEKRFGGWLSPTTCNPLDVFSESTNSKPE